MAVQHQGTPTTKVGTSTSASVNTPASLVAGDVLVCYVAVDTLATITKPGGFSTVATQTDSSSGNDQVLGCYYRIVDGTEATTYSWTFALNDYAAGMIVLRDDAGGTVKFNASSAAQTATANSIDGASVSTTVNNCLLVGGFAADGNSGAWTYTAPAAMTERVDVNTGAWASLEICTETRAASGSTGVRTATCTATGGGSIAIMAAFQPVAASGTTGGGSDTLLLLTEFSGGVTGAIAGVSDTLPLLTEAATGLTGAISGAVDTFNPLTAAAGGAITYQAGASDTLPTLTTAATGALTYFAGASDTLPTLTAAATGTAVSGTMTAGAADTLLPITEAASGQTGAIAGTENTLGALTGVSFGESGAEPISDATPLRGRAWWGYESFDGSNRPWWYRDLSDKARELERLRQARIEIGLLPKDEARAIAKVVREVESFVQEMPTPERADNYMARAEALTARLAEVIDQLEEDDDERAIEEMSRFFFRYSRCQENSTCRP